jgi:1,4-dihydroxy-2-naphthoate octaprenyltransferase
VATQVILLALPLGILIAAFLWINEFPDYHADLQAEKRTLVVRLGRRRASRLFAGLFATAFAMQALLPAFGLPRAVWLGAIGLPSAIFAARRALAHYEATAMLIPAQAQTLLAFVLLAIGSGLGLLAVPR